MNQQGISSGLYDEIRDYAELVDMVLVGLKAGTSSPQDESRIALAKLLEQLANGQTGDLSTRLIRLLLRGEPQLDTPHLAKIGRVLLASPDASVIAPLERLAAVLEQERLTAAARMRGSIR